MEGIGTIKFWEKELIHIIQLIAIGGTLKKGVRQFLERPIAKTKRLLNMSRSPVSLSALLKAKICSIGFPKTSIDEILIGADS